MPREGQPSSDLHARRRFAKRLRAARVMRGFETQKAFAAEVSLEPETYRRYERAETEPTIGSLVRISHRLDVTLDFLIAGTPEHDGEARKSADAA